MSSIQTWVQIAFVDFRLTLLARVAIQTNTVILRNTILAGRSVLAWVNRALVDIIPTIIAYVGVVS